MEAINRQQFIDQKIVELKKSMYGDEPDLMTEKEEQFFRRFLSKLLDDLKAVANEKGKEAIKEAEG